MLSRLAEIKAVARDGEQIEEIKSDDQRKDEEKIDMQNKDPELENFLAQFTKDVKNVECDMDTIDKNLGTLKDLQVKAVTATIQTEKKKIKEELSQLIKSIQGINKRVKVALEKLQNETKEKKDASEGKNTPEIRIREGQNMQLVKRFQTLIQRFQDLQAEHKQKHTDKMKRSYKMSHPNATDDEIEEMIQKQKLDEGQFKNKITKSQQATIDTLYAEAVETHNDILELEASLIELQDMFVSMAALVAIQDDLIESLENNVDKAEVYIKKAVEDLKTAKSVQTKGRNVKLIILIIVIIIVVVVGLILAFGGIAGIIAYFTTKK